MEEKLELEPLKTINKENRDKIKTQTTEIDK